MNFPFSLNKTALFTFILFAGVSTSALAGMNGQKNKQNKKDRQDDLSANNTAFRGAELLEQGKQATSGKVTTPKKDQTATAYWSGDTLNLEVKSKDGNRVALKIEFFWFEATMKRGSDFYVAIIRGNSSPNIGGSCTNFGSGAWSLSMPTKVRGAHEPAQFINVKSTRGRNGGAIRWDWSIPFQTYRYEPKQDVTIEQQYSLEAGANAQGSVNGSAGMEANGKELQGKGSLSGNASASASHKVSTDYTITLYRWEMQVNSGPTGIEWGMKPLAPKKATDNAYHEYYLAAQSASRGKPVVLPEIEFGGTFDCGRWSYIPDSSETLKATVKNIQISPPPKAQCTKNETFKNGKCVPDCKQGETLWNNKCVAKCASNEKRDQQSGKCVLDCDSDETTWNNRCVPECDPDEKRNQQTGKCVRDCNSNEKLLNGKCVAKCGPNEKRDANGDCVPKFKSCTTDADCSSSVRICVKGKCRKAKCLSSSDSVPNEVCDQGRCRAVDCKSDSDCKSNETCTAAGKCIAKQSNSSPDAGRTGSSQDAGSTGSNSQADAGSSSSGSNQSGSSNSGSGVNGSQQPARGNNPSADTGYDLTRPDSGSARQGATRQYEGGTCSSTGGSPVGPSLLLMALFGLAGLFRRRDE